jgi:hypothetical protein
MFGHYAQVCLLTFSAHFIHFPSVIFITLHTLSFELLN